MKKLYLATFALLCASSFTGLLHADGVNDQITITNMTTIPLSIYIKAAHKRDGGKIKYNTETFLLAPKQIASKAANNKSSHTFAYKRNKDKFGLQEMNVYDATDPKNLKLLKKYGYNKGEQYYGTISSPDYKGGFYTNIGYELLSSPNYLNLLNAKKRGISRRSVNIIGVDGSAQYV